MWKSKQDNRMTLLVIPNSTRPVRKLYVTRRSVRTAGVLALAAVLGTGVWVALEQRAQRRAAEALRLELQTQQEGYEQLVDRKQTELTELQERIAELNGQAAEVERRLAELRELEHEVQGLVGGVNGSGGAGGTAGRNGSSGIGGAAGSGGGSATAGGGAAGSSAAKPGEATGAEGRDGGSAAADAATARGTPGSAAAGAAAKPGAAAGTSGQADGGKPAAPYAAGSHGPLPAFTLPEAVPWYAAKGSSRKARYVPGTGIGFGPELRARKEGVSALSAAPAANAPAKYSPGAAFAPAPAASAPITYAPSAAPASARPLSAEAALVRIRPFFASRSAVTAAPSQLSVRFAAYSAESERLDEGLADLAEALRRKAQLQRATPSIWPTRSRLITSGFGYRRDPFTGKTDYHEGLDIGGETGDDVYAAAEGKVTEAGWNSSKGNYVAIRHTAGLQTVYMHLSKIATEVGRTVRKGELIGKVGSTGRSTGSHLHYQVEVGGKPVNPGKYLPAAEG